ncbi:MAG: hypothetical protein HY248_06310, partial [Fimbriimonas ginsengisoli]|nr:hypothetical protein [Fimbriimonas ginsengisoli]
MKDEIQRIIKLVQEGKLSAEDAAELIDAFAASDTQEPSQESAETPPPPPGSPKDPFKAFVESMERLGKEASSSVNWQDVAKQVREGAKKGVEALRSSIGEISKGGMPWFGAQDTREVTLPITVPAGKTLRIENPCGDVRVSGGFDRGTVSAKAHFRAASLEEARSKAEAYTLVVEESDHIVFLRQPDVTGLAVDLDLQLV